MTGAMVITGGRVTPCWSGWSLTTDTRRLTGTPATMMCTVTTRGTRGTMVEITTLTAGDTPGRDTHPTSPPTEATPTPTPPMVTSIIRTSITTTGSRGMTRSTRRSPPVQPSSEIRNRQPELQHDCLLHD